MSRYEVRVSKDYLVFAAGHFITYGGQCEPLHGHNYRVAAMVEGDVDENHYVFDFVELKAIMREIINELDHKMLLPEHNPALTIGEDGDSISVRYEERRYLFPRHDVVLLPVPNTTAEMLAKYLAGQLRETLSGRRVARLTAIAVEVEESVGQSAWYRESLG